MPEPAVQEKLHLTSEQAVRVTSRLFAAYLLFWVASDLTSIPSELLSVIHYARAGSIMGLSALSAFKTSYILRHYLLYLVANILRIALWLMAAGWFYRCGPRIASFFMAADE